MKAVHLLVVMSCLLGACQAGSKEFGPADTRAKRPTTATKKPSSPTPRPSASPVRQSAHDALVRAIHNALGATRVSRASLTLNSTSGVIANNGGNIISDNGLGIVSNNGSGAIAAPYRVRSAANQEDYDVETADLFYRFQFVSERAGSLKIYDRAAFKTLPEARREEALLDHFKWDDVKLVPLDLGPPMVGFIEFPLQIVTSKRVPFAKFMTTRQKIEVADLQSDVRHTIGWEYLIDVDTTLPDGTISTAKFKAVAGEADLERLDATGGGHQSLPVRSDVTGSNEHGAYTGTIDYHAGRVSLTHTATDGGAKTDILYETPLSGANSLAITCHEAKLKVEVSVDKSAKTGTGRVLDVSGASPKEVGKLTYDEAGLATITFTHGTTAEAKLL